MVASAFVGELEEAKGNAEAEATLRAAHPRLDALQEQYGPMTGAAAPARGGTALSASMIEVHFICVAPSAGKKMGRQTKKVPGNTYSLSCELTPFLALMYLPKPISPRQHVLLP